jgi:hypothetical protein
VVLRHGEYGGAGLEGGGFCHNGHGVRLSSCAGFVLPGLKPFFF